MGSEVIIANRFQVLGDSTDIDLVEKAAHNGGSNLDGTHNFENGVRGEINFVNDGELQLIRNYSDIGFNN